MRNKLLKKNVIPAINYHLWGTCNMNCKFCFGQFKSTQEKQNESKQLTKDQSIELVKQIINYDFEKITFSGGEPTLCPWLSELIKMTKQAGLITCIVTNGSNINEKWLKQNHTYIDWIALSIDSTNTSSNMKSGRCKSNNSQETYENYIEKIRLIKKYKIKLKINTVVSQYNYQEDMSSFINETEPIRWKLFQALPLKAENDKYSNEFCISLDKFNSYAERHKGLIHSTCVVPESNYQMTSSYLMIDPAGRFFDNSKGQINYSSSVIKVGIEKGLEQCLYSCKKFIQRGGIYEW